MWYIVIRFCIVDILYDRMIWLFGKLSFLVFCVDWIVEVISVLIIIVWVFYGVVCCVFLFMMCVRRF